MKNLIALTNDLIFSKTESNHRSYLRFYKNLAYICSDRNKPSFGTNLNFEKSGFPNSEPFPQIFL
jgi:hypothetical protein